jgi:hypothetical protein
VALVPFGASTWPREHYWHAWVMGEAIAEVGQAPVNDFLHAMLDFYMKRYAPAAHAAEVRRRELADG